MLPDNTLYFIFEELKEEACATFIASDKVYSGANIPDQIKGKKDLLFF